MIKKAGTILINKHDIGLIYRSNYDDYSFPKGHVEEGETEEQTAKREVKEETNIDVEIDSSKRYVMHYKTDKGKYKEVVLFVGKKIGGYLKMQPEEIIEAGWFEYQDALKILSYGNTRDLFKQVLQENNMN